MDMMIPENKADGKKRLRIGEFLLLSGMINQKTLDHALELQKTEKKKLGQILMELGVIDDVVIAKAISKQLRIPYVRLKNLSISPQVLAMVPAPMARKHLFIPIQLKGKGLIIAMANPTEREILRELWTVIQVPFEIQVAPEKDILEALLEHYPETEAPGAAVQTAASNRASDLPQQETRPDSATMGLSETSKCPEVKTILVVDDNEVIRKTMEKILCSEGFRVSTAQDGLEAIEILARLRPDLIVTDYMMPRMDGMALIKDLKSRPETAAIPIVMLTIKEEVDTEVDVIEAGADDYLTKPISRKRFVARIRRILR